MLCHPIDVLCPSVSWGMLSQRLRQLRKSKDMTLQEVAQRLGVTRASVSKWEGGSSRPDISRMDALAQLYGVSSQYLLGLSSSPNLRDLPVIELEFGVPLATLIELHSHRDRFPTRSNVSGGAFFVRLNDETLGDLGPKGVLPGSLVLVDPAVEARSGDIVLVGRPNGALLFMRLSIVGGVKMFSFVNHKFALKNAPTTSVEVHGVALESVLVTPLRDLFLSLAYA